MKMLFWNTHRNSNINSFILELVEQNEIDILILSEYAGNLEELSKYLMQSKKRLCKWNSSGCNRIQIWGNYVDVEPGEQNKYFSIQIVNDKYIICGVHMYSDLNGERFDERSFSTYPLNSFFHIKRLVISSHHYIPLLSEEYSTISSFTIKSSDELVLYNLRPSNKSEKEARSITESLGKEIVLNTLKCASLETK